MRSVVTQHELPILSDQLRHRLATLGVTVVRLDLTDGRMVPQGPSGPIEHLLITSRSFSAAVHDKAELLSQSPGCPQSIWPGIWLVPLPARNRRQYVHSLATSDAVFPSPMPRSDMSSLVVAILLTPELLNCEQIHHLCDSRQLDWQSTISQIDDGGLLTQAEVQRFANVLVWMRDDSVELDRSTAELHGLSQELTETYEELNLLYKLSNNMTVNQPSSSFLIESIRELQQVLGLRWMALQVIDDEPRLGQLENQIFVVGSVDVDQSILSELAKKLMAKQIFDSRIISPVHLTSSVSEKQDQLGMRHCTPQSFVIEDIAMLDIPMSQRVGQNLLAVPLVFDQRQLGILFGGDKANGSAINSIDAKLCNSLANSLAMFLRNMMLFDDMHAMFMESLRAFGNAIDAKDSYTHGHTERVALIGRDLATAAGLDEETVERVYLSGLVHDIGKIGVPEAVLTKPGPLTPDEMDKVKMHPEIGARIIGDVRQMQDLIPGVLYHHERWDGKGYPCQLAGRDIPLFGRLLCLADSFDAMSSDRTYRRSLSHREVLEEVKCCAGTQFDPNLVEVFLSLDFDLFFQLVGNLEQRM